MPAPESAQEQGRMDGHLPDYYATLGVGRDADSGELKQAFRRLALEAHPDRHGGTSDAKRRFQGVVEAYGVLGDADRRRSYDAGTLGRQQADASRSLQETLGALVDRVFGAKDLRKRRGRDHTYELRLTLAEAVRGVAREIYLAGTAACATCSGRGFAAGTVPDVCPTCDGSGGVETRRRVRSTIVACGQCAGRGYVFDSACLACRGTGEGEVIRPLRVEVPAGVDDGARLLVRSAGEPGGHGGPAGDLFLHVEVQEHPLLQRNDPDIVLVRPVPVLTAVLGGSIWVPTVDGQRRIRLKPGTRDGSLLRMVGYGVADPATGGRGDQLVTIRHELPASLPAPAREQLERITADLPGEIHPQCAEFERLALQGATGAEPGEAAS